LRPLPPVYRQRDEYFPVCVASADRRFAVILSFKTILA